MIDWLNIIVSRLFWNISFTEGQRDYIVTIAYRVHIDGPTVRLSDSLIVRHFCVKLTKYENKIKTVSKTLSGYPLPPTHRSKAKVILRSRMYTICCLVVIHPYVKIWYTYVKEQRYLARLKSMVKNIILILRSMVKVIQSSWMYATNFTTHVPNKVWLCKRTKKLRLK